MENIKTAPSPTKKRVSFSQFSTWAACRNHWFLDKVKKLSVFEDSVNTCFGTAIHEAIQLYIETLYKQGAAAAAEHDLPEIFRKAFGRELDAAKEKSGTKKDKTLLVEGDIETPAAINQKKFEYTEEEFNEFVTDGDNIFEAFLNMTNRIKHFPTGKYEFIASEDEIIIPIKNNVEFICYIDLVLKEKTTGRYRIIDIKTSTMGWNHYQKEDLIKISQVLLYKAFFSKKYNVPINMIDVEFFILRRRLYEGVDFPQSRIQNFAPRSDQKAVANVLNIFADFITESFKPDGTYIDDPKVYLKNPGKAKKNCKYCTHKKINCDAKSDIPKDEM